MRAAGLVRSVDVIAYFAKRGREGNARRIASALVANGREELRLEYPAVTAAERKSLAAARAALAKEK